MTTPSNSTPQATITLGEFDGAMTMKVVFDPQLLSDPRTNAVGELPLPQAVAVELMNHVEDRFRSNKEACIIWIEQKGERKRNLPEGVTKPA